MSEAARQWFPFVVVLFAAGVAGLLLGWLPVGAERGAADLPTSTTAVLGPPGESGQILGGTREPLPYEPTREPEPTLTSTLLVKVVFGGGDQVDTKCGSSLSPRRMRWDDLAGMAAAVGERKFAALPSELPEVLKTLAAGDAPSEELVADLRRTSGKTEGEALGRIVAADLQRELRSNELLEFGATWPESSAGPWIWYRLFELAPTVVNRVDIWDAALATGRPEIAEPLAWAVACRRDTLPLLSDRALAAVESHLLEQDPVPALAVAGEWAGRGRKEQAGVLFGAAIEGIYQYDVCFDEPPESIVEADGTVLHMATNQQRCSALLADVHRVVFENGLSSQIPHIATEEFAIRRAVARCEDVACGSMMFVYVGQGGGWRVAQQAGGQNFRACVADALEEVEDIRPQTVLLSVVGRSGCSE